MMHAFPRPICTNVGAIIWESVLGGGSIMVRVRLGIRFRVTFWSVDVMWGQVCSIHKCVCLPVYSAVQGVVD